MLLQTAVRRLQDHFISIILRVQSHGRTVINSSILLGSNQAHSMEMDFYMQIIQTWGYTTVLSY